MGADQWNCGARDAAPISRRRLALGLTCALGALAAGGAPARAQGLLQRGADLLRREGGEAAGGFTEAEAAQGLREALSIASGRVTAQLGQADGYLGDPNIRIPLPGFLGDAQGALRRVGMADLFDDLEVRLNRAAEAAAPRAKPLFQSAVSEMSVDDAVGIVRGADDAATRYFQDRMTPRLRAEFRPVVSVALEGAGAIAAFDRAAARYAKIPFTPSLGASAKADLIDHGVDASLDGLFFYLAREEAAIRNEPVKRTSEILRRVFG